jgi:hypothetical protein
VLGATLIRYSDILIPSSFHQVTDFIETVRVDVLKLPPAL